MSLAHEPAAPRPFSAMTQISGQKDSPAARTQPGWFDFDAVILF
jgi:hypothetical protein